MGFFSLLQFIANHPLNRPERARAITRFFRWQLATRMMRVPMAIPFVEGTCLLATKGMTGATGNWYCGLHEPHDMGFVLHLLRPDDLFLDVGANIGSYTVLAAGAVGANVIALEPVDAAFLTLESNIALNRLAGRVSAYQMGASDHVGTLRFTSNLDTVNHVVSADERGPSVAVQVTTIDILCATRVPQVIKIDVEGHEKYVLQGAAVTLTQPGVLAVVMETNGSGQRYGSGDEELLKLMQSHGFLPCSYNVLSRQLLDTAPVGGNTIFVRDRAQVQRLLRESRHYQLINGVV